MKKSKKKFVLAGLVLLAITMVLLPLSGCKNDSVPPEVEKQEQEDGGGSETDKNDTVPETPETPKYEVTFDVGGNREATAPASITVESGATLTAEQVPELSNTSSYQFMGWYLGDTEIEAGYTVTEPVTVTARWQGTNLTFTAEGEQSLIIEGYGDMQIPDSMYYSTDGSRWYKPEVDTPISFGNGTKLYLRAKSSMGTAEKPIDGLYDFYFVQFAFRDGTRVQAAGDIRTLVDWENPTEVDTSNARFHGLFMDCVELVTAPELPAETLADGCYAYMFKGCIGLTRAPKLEATNLAPECYRGMFEDCSQLTQAPELSATALAVSCYEGMFSGCTSLTQAPELPATKLVENCYEGMFSECTGLTQAPKLSATILATTCYVGMFSGCTGLTQAPELPATTLVDRCYYGMFYGCEKLSSVTMLATNVRASDALYCWLMDTAADGTLYVASGVGGYETIKGSLPTGWKIAFAATN